jgi:hypothetical protein
MSVFCPPLPHSGLSYFLESVYPSPFLSIFLWAHRRRTPVRCGQQRMLCVACACVCTVDCMYFYLHCNGKTVRLDELAGRVNDLSVVIFSGSSSPARRTTSHVMSHLPRPMFVPVPLPTSMSTRLDIRLPSALINLICPSTPPPRNDGGRYVLHHLPPRARSSSRPPQVTSHRSPRAHGGLNQAVHRSRVLGRYKIDTAGGGCMCDRNSRLPS